MQLQNSGKLETRFRFIVVLALIQEAIQYKKRENCELANRRRYTNGLTNTPQFSAMYVHAQITQGVHSRLNPRRRANKPCLRLTTHPRAGVRGESKKHNHKREKLAKKTHLRDWGQADAAPAAAPLVRGPCPAEAAYRPRSAVRTAVG